MKRSVSATLEPETVKARDRRRLRHLQPAPASTFETTVCNGHGDSATDSNDDDYSSVDDDVDISDDHRRQPAAKSSRTTDASSPSLKTSQKLHEAVVASTNSDGCDDDASLSLSDRKPRTACQLDIRLKGQSRDSHEIHEYNEHRESIAELDLIGERQQGIDSQRPSVGKQEFLERQILQLRSEVERLGNEKSTVDEERSRLIEECSSLRDRISVLESDCRTVEVAANESQLAQQRVVDLERQVEELVREKSVDKATVTRLRQVSSPEL
jgi:hypothetical protein